MRTVSITMVIFPMPAWLCQRPNDPNDNGLFCLGGKFHAQEGVQDGWRESFGKA
jgi:hypothetical protein